MIEERNLFHTAFDSKMFLQISADHILCGMLASDIQKPSIKNSDLWDGIGEDCYVEFRTWVGTRASNVQQGAGSILQSMLFFAWQILSCLDFESYSILKGITSRLQGWLFSKTSFTINFAWFDFDYHSVLIQLTLCWGSGSLPDVSCPYSQRCNALGLT